MGFTIAAQAQVVMGTTASPANVCTGSFYDSGGAGGNYASNEAEILTICPDNPGDLLRVTFNSFATEGNWDGL